jgi:hypothetical protein
MIGYIIAEAIPASDETPPDSADGGTVVTNFGDPAAIARQRLLEAGVPEAQIPALLERAIALLVGLERLAALDPGLPEPALTWTPVEEAAP